MANTPEKKQKQYSRRTCTPLMTPVPAQVVLNPVPRDKIRVVQMPNTQTAEQWCAKLEDAPLPTLDQVHHWLKILSERPLIPISRSSESPQVQQRRQQVTILLSGEASKQPAVHCSIQHGAIAFSLKHFDDLPASGSVRLPVVRELFGCSNATVWRRSRTGMLIPKSRKLSSKITVWNVGELREALARQKKGGEDA